MGRFEAAPRVRSRMKNWKGSEVELRPIYLVAAHYAPTRYAELLDALSPAVVITHVDRKTDAAPFREAASTHPSVIFVPDNERVDVVWGGWSQVAATLAMLVLAQPIAEPDDYVIFLSGDSYPLQNTDGIQAFFAASDGAQYINSVSMPSLEQSKPLSRISHAYLEYNPRNGKRNFSRRLFNRTGFPRNYVDALGGRQPRAGSTWWALTGEAVSWIIREVHRDEKFTKFCHYTKMPDEFFFQTLLGASPFSAKTRGSVMFADWSRPTGAKPAILDLEHIDELARHSLVTDNNGYGRSVALFARKVKDDVTSARIRTELWPLPAPGALD